MALDHSAAWWDLPIVVLDFETTGPIPTVCEPVSVAVIRLEQGREVEHYHSLLKPTGPIPDGARAVHGISDAMVENAPTLMEVAADLARVAKDAVPAGYNGITFDRRILHRYITGSDVPLFDPDQKWLDAYVMIRAMDRYVSGKGRNKLEQVCKRWGCPFPEGKAHDALEDVRAVGRLLVRMLELGKLRPGVSLQRILDHTLMRAEEQEKDFAQWLERQKAKEAQTQLDLGGTTDGSDADAGANGLDGPQQDRPMQGMQGTGPEAGPDR